MPDEEPVEIWDRFEPASHRNVRNPRVRQIRQHLAGTRHSETRQIGTEGSSCMLAEDPAEAVRTERRHPRSIRQSDGLIQILTDVVDGLAQPGRGCQCGRLRDHSRLFAEPANKVLDHAQARIQRGSIRSRHRPHFHACQCPARRFNCHHTANKAVSANRPAQGFCTVSSGVELLVKPQTLDRSVRQPASLLASVMLARRHLEGFARDDQPNGQAGCCGEAP